MKTADKIMQEQGLRVEWLKQYEPDTYNSIRKAMDEFADQYTEWKINNLYKLRKSILTNEEITNAYVEARDKDKKNKLDYRDRDYFQAGVDFAINYLLKTNSND